MYEVAALTTRPGFAHDPPGRHRVVPDPHQLLALPRPDPRGLVILASVFQLPLGGSPHVVIEQHASGAVPRRQCGPNTNEVLAREAVISTTSSGSAPPFASSTARSTGSTSSSPIGTSEAASSGSSRSR